MSATKFINLEQLQATAQALLVKINEQGDLKVDKHQVIPATSEGLLIGTIAGESFYAPNPDLSNYASWSSLEDTLAPVAWTNSYNSLTDLPSIPSTASDVGISTYVSSFNGSSGAITYNAPVSSVNGATGSVVISRIKTSSWNEMVEFALTGTYTTNDNSAPTQLINLPWAKFSKSTTDYARLMLGTSTTPGVIRLCNGNSSSYDLKVSADSAASGTITFQAASGTVAFLSDIPQSLPESDPIFVASAAYGITSADISSWTAKPTTDTTYSISMSSNRIILTSSAGDSSYVDLPIYDGTVEDPEEEEEP